MRERNESIIASREVVKRITFPEFMSPELMAQWIESIPQFLLKDLKDPEWPQTPTCDLNLTRDGYGAISVKDESVNPTGTMKDRPAWEFVKLYADYAFGLFLRTSGFNEAKAKDFLSKQRIPRFTLITSGNEGAAVATAFERYGLPPPKIVVGRMALAQEVKRLSRLRADIYRVDLSKRLDPMLMKVITENEHGVEITSQSPHFLPQVVFYDWLVHECFREQPDDVYVPYGSGRLMENFLTWQSLTLHNGMNPDPRLGVQGEDPSVIRDMISCVQRLNVFGAEPSNPDSDADKLTAPYKPFLIFREEDIESQATLHRTGAETAKISVEESYIHGAYEIFQREGIKAEVSAAAGLALYMQRCDSVGKKERDRIITRKALIVNTGRGSDIEPS
ncbi:PLP-dependent lyase/thiolase [Candidatus Uhrbacteria bacterium]|nr:PLP-dependent lyase/thiolase [Candidatus Uhrbacteria bacterium]